MSTDSNDTQDTTVTPAVTEEGVRDTTSVPEHVENTPSAAGPDATVTPVEFDKDAADKVKAPAVEVTGGESLVVEDETETAGELQVVNETQEALVGEERTGPTDTVNVHEVAVKTDRRVRHVIVPEEGRGTLDLPIHALAGERVEDVFAREASKSDD